MEQTVRITTNSIVRVKLTRRGKEHYSAYYRQRAISNYPTEDADGWLQDTLWHLMLVFGEIMYTGAPHTFQNGGEIIVRLENAS